MECCGRGIRTPDLLVMRAYYGFHRDHPNDDFVVWTIHSPTKSWFGCLPSSLYTFSPIANLARDYLALARSDFPEFDRLS